MHVLIAVTMQMVETAHAVAFALIVTDVEVDAEVVIVLQYYAQRQHHAQDLDPPQHDRNRHHNQRHNQLRHHPTHRNQRHHPHRQVAIVHHVLTVGRNVMIVVMVASVANMKTSVQVDVMLVLIAVNAPA